MTREELKAAAGEAEKVGRARQEFIDSLSEADQVEYLVMEKEEGGDLDTDLTGDSNPAALALGRQQDYLNSLSELDRADFWTLSEQQKKDRLETFEQQRIGGPKAAAPQKSALGPSEVPIGDFKNVPQDPMRPKGGQREVGDANAAGMPATVTQAEIDDAKAVKEDEAASLKGKRVVDT